MSHKAKVKASNKRRGKTKEKKQPKQPKWPEAERPYRMFDLDLNPQAFEGSHEDLLNAIEALLLEMAEEEMRPLNKKDRKPVEVNGRKYTSTGGAFLVRVLAPDGDEKKVVILLIGLDNLYLQGFHVGGVWFLLSDCAVPVPPRSQVFYGKTEVEDDAGEKYIFVDGIYLLPWNGSYTKLNGGRRQPFKYNAFQASHARLGNARKTVANQDGSSLESDVAFYAIGICECMRFWNVNRWVIAHCTDPLILENVYPTKEIDTTIGNWGTSSTDSYGSNPPPWLRIIKRNLHEHEKLKPEMVYVKKENNVSKEVSAMDKCNGGKKNEDEKRRVETSLDEAFKQVEDDDEADSEQAIQDMPLDEEGTQDTKDSCGEATSNAIIPAPQKMLLKAPDFAGPSKSTTSDRLLTSALMERLPSGWSKPAWHAPWKNYKVISGHLGWVRSIAFDPGSEQFCTGSADKTIKIWDLASGTLKLTLTGHIEQVCGLAASQRHTYLFSAGDDKEVKCWDLQKNKVIRSYHGVSGVSCITLHPTMDVLVTGGRDSVCKVWDIRTKKHVSALTGHGDTIYSVFARPMDPQVVTASRDTTIKFWDLVAGKTMCTLTQHKKSVRAMALHPKKTSFASASAENIKKFSLPRGDFLHNMLSQEKTILNAMAVNEDGVLATAGDNGSMRFWDWESGHIFQQEQAIVKPGSAACIHALSYDNSGSRLVTCEADKTVKMWKEDLTATPETHPINFKPPEDIRGD